MRTFKEAVWSGIVVGLIAGCTCGLLLALFSR